MLGRTEPVLKRGGRHIHHRLPQSLTGGAEPKLKMTGRWSKSHLAPKACAEIRYAARGRDGRQIRQRKTALKILLQVIDRFLDAVGIGRPARFATTCRMSIRKTGSTS